MQVAFHVGSESQPMVAALLTLTGPMSAKSLVVLLHDLGQRTTVQIVVFNASGQKNFVVDTVDKQKWHLLSLS